jgi:hypothetical protein
MFSIEPSWQETRPTNDTRCSTTARKNQNQENKLMETKDGERLDTGTTGATGQADPAMATLGEVDRAEDRSR